MKIPPITMGIFAGQFNSQLGKGAFEITECGKRFKDPKIDAVYQGFLMGAQFVTTNVLKQLVDSSIATEEVANSNLAKCSERDEK